MDQENRMPLIGDKAPSFEAVTTQGPYQIPGGLRRQMGDPLLPSCGFHPGLHHGVYDLRLHDRRVQGSQY